jgi:2'-5' RNA ligase
VTNPNHQVAKPGDIFLLLVPSAQELHRLNTWQSGLQARFGGRVVPDPHITCQRFTPGRGKSANDCVGQLSTHLASIRTFQIYTDRLIQFYAPYWQNHVLRWRVQESDEYAEFRDRLEIALQHIRCPSHFNRRRHASCTAIELDQPTRLPLESAESGYPIPLFLARTLWISELQADHQFSILETIYFRQD